MTSSDTINKANYHNIYDEIQHKIQYSKPYYANNTTVRKCITDFDNFPYSRWYRGIASSKYPIIIERESGYRKVLPTYNEEQVNNYNYRFSATKTDKNQISGINGYGSGNQNINQCFESACSTVYPCQNKNDLDYKEAKIANTTNLFPIAP
jgi:hypothetical protein